MAFKSTHLWNVDVTITPIDYAARRLDLRFADPRTAAAALRMMADQIERECQLRYGSEKPEEVPLLTVV